jgi:hypothetical protein
MYVENNPGAAYAVTPAISSKLCEIGNSQEFYLV